jgi:hypothetical protein
MVCIDYLKLQTMTALNKSFCGGGPGGAVFSKSAPPGRRRHFEPGVDQSFIKYYNWI